MRFGPSGGNDGNDAPAYGVGDEDRPAIYQANRIEALLVSSTEIVELHQ
jgi:hypothetical protein